MSLELKCSQVFVKVLNSCWSMLTQASVWVCVYVCIHEDVCVCVRARMCECVCVLEGNCFLQPVQISSWPLSYCLVTHAMFFASPSIPGFDVVIMVAKKKKR